MAFAAMAEIEIARQPEHARIEGERGDADQELGHEERGEEHEQRQPSALGGIAEQADGAARGEER